MTDLSSLAKKHKSDKFGAHFYTPVYEKYMRDKKNKKVNILEIGVGGWSHKKGYSDPYKGGESLKMWRDYFKHGKVYGLDIFKKEINLGNRVKIFQGSQDDTKILSKIIKKSGKLDYIVDDGSHLYKDVVLSFNYLFNHLKNGGFYFIEDIQTSYLREFGGDGFNLQNKNTIINYFKGIIDKINHKEIENPFYKIDEIAKNVTEVHFYHNLIVIKKEKNTELSTILINNRRLVSGKNLLGLRSFIKMTKYFFLYLKSMFNNFIDLIKI